MSIANQKGGFFRTLEINRDSVADSATTLIEPILKQAQNYVVQVQRFVTNFTPPINTLTEPMFTIRAKGYMQGDDVVWLTTKAESIARGEIKFIPTNVRTITELIRQCLAFFRDLDDVSFVINPEFRGLIRMRQDFYLHYIEVGKTYQKLLGLPKYISYFRGKVTYDPANPLAGSSAIQSPRVFRSGDEIADDEKDEEDYYFRPTEEFRDEDGGVLTFSCDNTMLLCDTRQYIDVTFTMPHISQLCILNGIEQRKKLLARFPVRDFEDTEHVSKADYRTYSVRENVTLGLEDLCKNNPNVHSMLLLPGEVQHANVRIETTYLEDQKFKTTPAAFGASGFWSLKLLLAKKVK